MSPAPYKLGRSPPARDDCDPAFPAAGHPAAGPSHVQVVRPRRCAAAGAPPGPAAEPAGTQPATAGTQHHPLASGPRLHREWAVVGQRAAPGTPRTRGTSDIGQHHVPAPACPERTPPGRRHWTHEIGKDTSRTSGLAMCGDEFLQPRRHGNQREPRTPSSTTRTRAANGVRTSSGHRSGRLARSQPAPT
jgi:hypothetical protein